MLPGLLKNNYMVDTSEQVRARVEREHRHHTTPKNSAARYACHVWEDIHSVLAPEVTAFALPPTPAPKEPLVAHGLHVPSGPSAAVA